MWQSFSKFHCIVLYNYFFVCTTVSPLYQCQSSLEQSGQVFIPNIPDFYFTPENAASFRGNGGNLTTITQRGTTYIFTLPALSAQRNCSGTVLSIQHCFQARARDIGQVRRVFDLLNVTIDGGQFTVNERFSVEATLQEEMCADPPGSVERVCCTNGSLQFRLPASSFVFGVVITDNNIRLLTFTSAVTEYDVERWVRQPSGNYGPMPGDTFSAGDSQTDRSLLLLRFFLGKINK